ncbi:UNVERIFIED_CONTAM: hypothetical protein HDU68_008189, partial [Siphonaria sp. JEL0065]
MKCKETLLRQTKDFKGSRGLSPLKSPYQRYRAPDDGDDEVEEMSVERGRSTAATSARQ